jgi:hypothetical protein
MHGCRAGQDDMPSPEISGAPYADGNGHPQTASLIPVADPLLCWSRWQGSLNHGECGENSLDRDFSSRTRRLIALHKKTTIRPTNGERIEGHVMVHRTDIAGWVGCSMGRVSPGKDGMCRHAPNALIEKRHLRRLRLSLSSAARTAAVSS